MIVSRHQVSDDIGKLGEPTKYFREGKALNFCLQAFLPDIWNQTVFKARNIGVALASVFSIVTVGFERNDVPSVEEQLTHEYRDAVFVSPRLEPREIFVFDVCG